MPDSVLDDNLFADALVGVVDSVRGTIHEALGTRPYRVAIVTRRWSGGQLGLGTPSDHVLELEPPPKVERVSQDRIGPGGREAAGSAVLTRISLTYTEAELAPKAGPDTEVAYRISEAHGQAQRPTWWVLAGTPLARRTNGTDWRLVLEQTSDLSDFDRTDP